MVYQHIKTSTGSSTSCTAFGHGNLVLKDTRTDDGNFLWQSFDYPSDTLLPGMKLGKNFETGLERYLYSWKSNDDPSPGDFTYHCNLSGYPQNVIRKGSVEQYRSGPWNGVRFSGVPSLIPNAIYRYRLVFNDKEAYYSYDLLNNSVISRVILSQNGVVQRWTRPIGRSQDWIIAILNALCGAYGTCNIGDSLQCGCLNKFAPKQSDDWANTDWRSMGTPLDCYKNGSDGFLKYHDVKLPDTRNFSFNVSMSLEECQKACSNNCSCMAYANLNIRDGVSGCLLWFGDLIDIRDFPEGAGQDVYVRVASSDSEIVAIPSVRIHNLVGTKNFGGPKSSSNRKKGIAMKVSLPLSVGMLLLGLILTLEKVDRLSLLSSLILLWGHDSQQEDTNESQDENVELPVVSLSEISSSTNNFSIDNKLGEGGFGPVYKSDEVEPEPATAVDAEMTGESFGREYEVAAPE
ncbi:hypothetical protein RJ639_003805 [Escallonia herrerae]|uniref:Apple domain-containing protein n=1 Tax=Escallonia herrerae TaxID=1293975 RepID=A0AA88W3H7_9ASTE|nr:hypothetical protein RJ639_003805 [Escallonia herrerae]